MVSSYTVEPIMIKSNNESSCMENRFQYSQHIYGQILNTSEIAIAVLIYTSIYFHPLTPDFNIIKKLIRDLREKLALFCISVSNI